MREVSAWVPRARAPDDDSRFCASRIDRPARRVRGPRGALARTHGKSFEGVLDRAETGREPNERRIRKPSESRAERRRSQSRWVQEACRFRSETKIRPRRRDSQAGFQGARTACLGGNRCRAHQAGSHQLITSTSNAIVGVATPVQHCAAGDRNARGAPGFHRTLKEVADEVNPIALVERHFFRPRPGVPRSWGFWPASGGKIRPGFFESG